MGARALVALERPDGRYDLYHTQWGGERVDRLVSLVRAGEVPTDLVDTDPLDTGVHTEQVLAPVDTREYEAVVVGGERPDAYLVCRVAVDSDSRAERSTALVPYSDRMAAERIRQFLRTTRDVLGDAVEAGLVPASVATGYVAARLARHPDTPVDGEEILWLSPGGDAEQGGYKG